MYPRAISRYRFWKNACKRWFVLKSTLVRLTPKLYKQLKVRSLVQRRPMSDIVREALELHFKMRPITHSKFRTYLKEVLAEDKEILDGLRHL